jgi:NADH-quinone oxidoreductase subunit L
MPYIQLILLIPLLTFVLLFVLGKRANDYSGWLAIAATLLGLAYTLWLIHWTHLSEDILPAINWVSIGGYDFDLSFRFETTSNKMLLVVHFVAVLVQVFSISYMSHDAARWRYFALLQLFLFSMIGIVLSEDLLLMYVFWELVGLSSYLLIGFWNSKPRAVWAAKKAFLLNRIGDVGFLIGIILYFLEFHTTLIMESISVIPGFDSHLTIIGLLLFCGTIGKSAQWPLSAWLPDAMEGPTPVSALIHAATMVAAGIFMLAKVSFLLRPDALLFIATIGTITMLLGGYRAIFQTDIKKLLAFSTISQLGLMVLGIGVGTPQGALFHLTTHAFFKAGLFLCAGVVIHFAPLPNKGGIVGWDLQSCTHKAADLQSEPDPQDMRLMGGLRRLLPVTFWAYTVCAAALIGLPFFSGFLSKETILTQTFVFAAEHGGLAYLFPILAIVSSAMTAIYMTKQWKMVFLGVRTVDGDSSNNNYEDWLMKIPIVILATLSLFFWFSVNPFQMSNNFFLAVVNENTNQTYIAIASVIASLSGILIGYRFNFGQSKFSEFLESIYNQHLKKLIRRLSRQISLFDRFGIDRIVNGLGNVTVIFAHFWSRFDSLIIDGLVNALAAVAAFVGNRVRVFQNGRVQSYFVVSIIGFLLIVFYLIF